MDSCEKPWSGADTRNLFSKQSSTKDKFVEVAGLSGIVNVHFKIMSEYP